MSFLDAPAASVGQQKMYDEDMAHDGYVWDSTKLWAQDPNLDEAFGALLTAVADAAKLTFRERAMLVIGQASTIGDSYCSLAWGRWLTEEVDADTAAAALRRDEDPFNERERVLAAWARKVAGDPNATTPHDIEQLKDAGFDDHQIFTLTLYTTLRMAMSTTNDALGARPDAALADVLNPEVRGAVTWGRQPA